MSLGRTDGVMETSKIKIRIGDHEFEAEGPTESVQRQFDSFKEIIVSLPTKSAPQVMQNTNNNLQNQSHPTNFQHIHLERIMHVVGRIVSLTAIPTSTEDAALLIMLGHKDMRNNQAVTGQEIGDGLAQSGRPVPRVDRVMEKAIENAHVLKSGIKRSTRYRLTNEGLKKVLAVAQELINSLPK
jgi:hypothetical protein